MRWIYKTVHFELKKEGLLGSTFIDETEIEQELNEYGSAGWELISLMEVKDGLIGVLKQPLDDLADYDAADREFDQKVKLTPTAPVVRQETEEIFETYAVEEEEDISAEPEEPELAEELEEDQQLLKTERKIGEIRIE